MRTKLPSPARQFLRTLDGRRARPIVDTFHHWLDQRQLTLAELTPEHFEQFLDRFRAPRIPTSIRAEHFQVARDYVQWLHDRALVGFDPSPLRRPQPLPSIAREFLASLAPTHRPGTCINYAHALRTFHRWLEPRELDPQRLTRRDLAPWLVELHAKGLAPITRYQCTGSRSARRFVSRWRGDVDRGRSAPARASRGPSRVPFPTLHGERERERLVAGREWPGKRSALPFRSRPQLRNGNGPPVTGAYDGASSGETSERVAEALVAHAELGAELGAAQGRFGAREPLEEAAVQIRGRLVG